jgi:5'-nucleotidase
VLTELGRVTVVAPRVEQSGIGHAITYRTPITAERVTGRDGAAAYAVAGTPADCVKFGLLKVLGGRADLIVSGINPGMNLGQNLFYSGTVAAAVEGAIFGVLSVAVSMHGADEGRLEPAARQALRAVRTILALRAGSPDGDLVRRTANRTANAKRPAGCAYNVNLPALDGADPQIRFTHQCEAQFPETYHPAAGAPPGTESFQLSLADGGQGPRGGERLPEGCDAEAVAAGMISITPLRATLTDMEGLRAADRFCGGNGK